MQLQIHTKTKPNPAAPLTGMKISLVEDCPQQSRIYTRFLEKAGAHVLTESDGASLVQLTSTELQTFDAVVLDFMLPYEDGIDITKHLRGLGYQNPIVAISVCDEPDLCQRWLNAGCDIFLEKPFTRTILIATIVQLLEVSREMARVSATASLSRTNASVSLVCHDSSK